MKTVTYSNTNMSVFPSSSEFRNVVVVVKAEKEDCFPTQA